MTIRRLRNTTSNIQSKTQENAKGSKAKRSQLRQHLLETLESRQLMAVGPQLIGVQPNNSDLIENGVIRNIAPRELTFRFDDSQIIDQATVGGIRVTRAGGDGSFTLPSVSSDFGTTGRADIQLTTRNAADTMTVNVAKADLGLFTVAQLGIANNNLLITLNSNPTAQVTAQGLVNLINTSNVTSGRLTARLNGGLGTARLNEVDPANIGTLRLVASNDVVVVPGAVVIGDRPNENEVTLRFAENLPDDMYRLEVFGFDDAGRGIRGLRNTDGQFFVPSNPNTRQETIDFRLDLGPKVTAVVPQPIVRLANSSLSQQRDTIVVYFDNDKLLVENGPDGLPTAGSVENPAFYQLIYTADTVRNTDDLPAFLPRTVTYNASANTATLVFERDLDLLPGPTVPSSTFRLRIGTRETTPMAPVRSEATATAITDLNSGGFAKVRFSSKAVGEVGSGISVSFVNTGVLAAPSITVTGQSIRVNYGGSTVTVNDLILALESNPESSALIKTTLEPGSDGTRLISNRPINYSPVTLYGMGSSFDTATNLGTIGSVNVPMTSLLLSSSIDPETYALDLPGASNDPAHRIVPEQMENHINPAFGGDDFPGIRTIYYNFRANYGFDGVTPVFNAITEKQKDRIREAFTLWSNQVGVQFVETSNSGLTIALGTLGALGTGPDVEIHGPWGVRIDPTYQTSLAVFSANSVWNDNYGENLTRTAAASIGFMLGLSRAGNLDPSQLLNLDGGFINAGGSDRNFEPVFPGNQDIIHGQYLHRPEGSDIDLYRFDIDFGADGASRTGVFVAETFAERLENSSTLDSRLALYQQTQATALSNLGVGQGVQVKFEAARPGKLGNNLQVFVTRSNRGVGALPIVNAFPNAVTIDLNSTVGSETTLAQMITAIDTNSAARSLVKISRISGSDTTVIGNRDITYSPITLTGGEMKLISQNDNYFSDDSLIRTTLSSGIYYLGVTSTGNDDYDATIEGTGTGGRTEGKYDLRLTFRSQTDSSDSIQDVAGPGGDTSLALDGDSDGVVGGVYNFWFQTRPLDRALNFNAGGSADLEQRIITIRGGNGSEVRFEFSIDSTVGIGNTRIPYTLTSTASDLASNLAAAIASRTELGVTADVTGSRIVLQGERLIQLSPGLTIADLSGKTIFVDKSAGPNADGSLARPFNNIAGSGVANAFAATVPGDIVRIVGNGGSDNRLETVGDNLAYEIGFGLLSGSVLSDGATMDVPKGVTVMIDAGAVFKMNRSRIGVGSSSLSVDRSGGALQVLGAPILLDRVGNALKLNDGTVAAGSVFFTSWLDESIGFDNYSPRTTPAAGNWGGLLFKRDLDAAAGRFDLEDEGIFRQYVNHADIRYGGSSAVVVDAVQQTVNSIQIADMRPTITHNKISFGADAAMSATPDSFRETLFSEPAFQRKGSFTPDYDRVGPQIHDNVLTRNSINGLFVRVSTIAGGELRELTVPGRFNDVDIVHVISENIVIQGVPGASLLDDTVLPSNLISMRGRTGGILGTGTYNYKLTYVDVNGYETPPSDATQNVILTGTQTAISITGLPGVTGEFVSRRLYRSSNAGSGPYVLAAELDGNSFSYEDLGKTLSSTSDSKAGLFRDRPDVRGVTTQLVAGTVLPSGSYTYRIVMVDEAGRESLASSPTSVITNASGNRSILLNNLPALQPGYASRRIYRSTSSGAGAFRLIADIQNESTTSYLDAGTNLTGTLQLTSLGTIRPRLDASLSIDPGMIIKLEGARIEIGHSAQLLAEGVDGGRIVFTSKQDDRFGIGGTFDTNNNGLNEARDSRPGDWSGIYASPGSNLQMDHGVVAYAGGSSRIEGTFKAFSTIELQQATSRLANTTFENNANGMGGQGPIDRLGRPANENYPLGNNNSRGSTVFIRGTQPVIIGNVFQNNVGSALTIDANSMDAKLRGDTGRQSGNIDQNLTLEANRGPLFRENRLFNNSINGLEIRGDASTNNRSESVLAVRDLQRNILTTESVWDDTDIVHVLFDSITISNLEHSGGLRLQSAINESLVIKMEGQGSNFDKERGTGFTATGRLSSISDRVGGTVHVLGQPGFPVVLTSLRDDSVGSGTQPDGRPQTDTNNDGIASIPRPGDWRSMLFDSFSNDRFVVVAMEIEPPDTVAPGSNDSAVSAQFLGALAPNESTMDENLPLGYVVNGVLSEPNDQDVYSFVATAGTEVWFDIDSTRYSLDTVIEILNANGELLARSDDSTDEQAGVDTIFTTPLIDSRNANPIVRRVNSASRRHESGLLKDDGTTNVKDAAVRILLPGVAGSTSSYFFRVRSKSLNINNSAAGLTSGSYSVQVRLRDQQEYPGSTVQFADIRYATNGVYTSGLPFNSPLTGEANVRMFDGTDDNITHVGNVHMSNRGAISVAGAITGGVANVMTFDVGDIDLIRASGTSRYPISIDVDYADGLNRPDLIATLFGPGGSVIATSNDSNIIDDRPGPLKGSDLSDLSRGSVGTRDPFIGPVSLARGRYRLVISGGNGDYQVEIRKSDNAIRSNATVYRGSNSTSLQIADGLVIPDKSVAELSDGSNRIRFQFTYDGVFDFGNTPVPISATSTRVQIADAFRDAVNTMFTQNRFRVTVANTDGPIVFPAVAATSTIVNFVGDVEFVSGADLFGADSLLVFTGIGDVNIHRDQGQFIINASTISDARDYGVFSGPADLYYADGRAAQPLYLIGGPTFLSNQAGAPGLGGQYARKLPVLNTVPFGVGAGSVAERAGVAPGLVVVNNVLDSSGLGGIHVSGQTPIWRITAFPGKNDDIAKNENFPAFPDHSGSFHADGDLLVLDYGRQRVTFEFEDLSGADAGGPILGSGVVGGNGWGANNVPIHYREDAGQLYLRTPDVPSGYSSDEVVKSIRDAIHASTLVTNGTTQVIRSWVEPEGRFNQSPIDPETNFGGSENSIIIEGPQSIQYFGRAGNPLEIVRLGEYQAAPFMRVVNNTIIGNDGRASFNAERIDTDANDTIKGAAETWQGTGTNTAAYTVDGVLTADPLSTGSSDVDLYKFYLNVGDRVLIDVDTSATSTLDSALKVFDASGRAQIVSDGVDRTTSDDRNAPGENQARDAYVDFTASVAGVYYAAISASGNTNYDPLSLADRRRGATSGAYTLSIKVLKPESFVITAQNPAAYQDGETFTIDQVADFANTTSRSRTFEFTRTGIVQAGNVPVYIGPEYNYTDMARAIAGAINAAGMLNIQSLDNGIFGLANPLAPVSAIALGGINGHDPTMDVAGGSHGDLGINSGNIRGAELQAGLGRYRGRGDAGHNNDQPPGDVVLTSTQGNGFTSATTVYRGHFNRNMGHDRTMSQPFLTNSGDIPITARGNGTTEKYVVVRNATGITSNGSIQVDKDTGANNNLNQILPESGILVLGGATPTVMNNVFLNVQTPIVQEATAGGAAVRPSAVVVGGNTYQYFETRAAFAYLGRGVEASPTNVPNTSLDFNFIAGDTERLFMDAPGGRFLPSATSRVIDSSIDSLPERAGLRAVKQAVGIAPSPILAPDRDHSGQLRSDDPNIAPPSGLGGNVFKDRGATDRADFVGPTAVTVNPIDNDAQRVDIDSTASVLRLSSGVYPEFRIQLKDGFESSNLQAGTGIDDDSVVGRDGGNRLPGSVLTITENGRLLTEGIDYVFSYNRTTNEIILKPLAGIWKNERVYDITLNNKDRFVIDATAGDNVSDGHTFAIRDSNGGNVTFEYESGFRLQVPTSLELNIPLAGGGAGGIADGDRFVLNNGTTLFTFEFDSNNNTIAGTRRIPFTTLSSRSEIATAILAAVATVPNVQAKVDSATGRLFINAASGAWLDTNNAGALTQPIANIGLLVPVPSTIVNGRTFQISDGSATVVFEFNRNAAAPNPNGNVRIIIAQTTTTAAQVAELIQAAIESTALNLNSQIIDSNKLFLGLPKDGSVALGTSGLVSVGVSRPVMDGQSFVISRTVGSTVTSRTFEIDFTGSGSIPGSTLILLDATDSQIEIADKLATAIRGAGLDLNPIHVGNGNISVGGTLEHSITVANAPTIGLFGAPGVQGNTTLDILDTLLLRLPTLGGAAIVEDSSFSITNNGRTVVFEFDGDLSGATIPNNRLIPFTAGQSADQLVAVMLPIIQNAGLGIVPRSIGGGTIDLGLLPTSILTLSNSGLTTERSTVNDGEFFIISNGLVTIEFEFENLSLGNGRDPSRIPIRYNNQSTKSDVFLAMKAAIESSTLGLQTVIQSNGIRLLDTAAFTTTTENAPSLSLTGVAGGAIGIRFVQDASFTPEQIRSSIINAINQAQREGRTSLQAKLRGGSTLFVEDAITISEGVDSFFLRGIQDKADNFLKSNRINNETQFTILMPGVLLDFGDAPDPVTTTPGRYPTSLNFDGARHVSNATALRLGPTISSELDGSPTPRADGDSADDGVMFRFQGADKAMFNRNVDTTVTITLTQPGIVDGWIDFNADGDWTDAGENVLNGVVFTETTLTQSFQIRLPANAPVPTVSTNSFARFRASTAGNTLPTGLALDGEVEDYLVRIVPGIPPIGASDSYVMNEDQEYVTTDPRGLLTPANVGDNGVLANDSSPDGRQLFARVLTPPQHVVANSFVFNPDGTFTYVPTPDYVGQDTFVYLSFVNIDLGENEILESMVPTTVTFTIRPVNDTPTASNFSQIIDEDVPLTLTTQQVVALSTASPGPENEADQTLTLSLPSGASTQGGTVSLVNGSILYTPLQDFSGEDTFTFTLTDNGVTGTFADPLSVTRTVTITVRDKNDPPIVTPKSFAMAEDGVDVRSTDFYINNDTAGPAPELLPPNAQIISFTSVEPRSEFGGTVSLANGQITYRPAPDFNGTDRIYYIITDNGTSQGLADPQSSRGTVTVTVDAREDDPRVLAQFGTLNMMEDDPARVLSFANFFFDPDVIPNGEVLTYRILSNSNPGLVEPTLDGDNLTIQPKPDQNGQAVIIFEARDTTNRFVTNTLTVVVAAVSDNPRLVSPLPNLNVNEDSTIQPITLSPQYFFEPDTINGDVLTFSVITSNEGLVSASIANGQLILRLAPNASGIATITVRAVDLAGNAVEDSFDVNIAAVNDAPTVVDDLFYQTRQTVELRTTDARGTLTSLLNDNGLLANDFDIEGNSFTARLRTPPIFGSVTINPDGTFIYQPRNAIQGTIDSFEYEAVDSLGGISLPGRVNITITAPPPARHQNQQLNQDVNADGFVSPIDVLLVVNFINFSGQSSVSVIGLSEPPPYRDVNGDNSINGLDVLELINYINTRGNGEGEGEGSSYVGLSMDVGASAAPMVTSDTFGWSGAVMRSGSNLGTTMSTVAQGGSQVGRLANAAMPWTEMSQMAVEPSLAEYLASFGNESEEEAEEVANLVGSATREEDYESLDSFFAEAFGQ